MVKNYIRIAARNLWKQKLFSFVNVIFTTIYNLNR